MTKISIYRGDSKILYFTLTTENEAGATIAYDLTDVTAVNFSVKRDIEDTTFLIDKECVVTSPATGGLCTVVLLTTETKDISNSTIAEVEVDIDGTEKVTALQFELEFVKDVKKEVDK